jgi:hypothetical protein
MTNRIHKTFLLLTTLTALLLILAASSCYTILRHPRIVEAGYERPSGGQCSTCHSDEEIWQFHHPHTRYYDPHFDGWQSFYYLPWWYDDYWFYADSEDPETIPLLRRSLRPKESKRNDVEIFRDNTRPISGKEKYSSPVGNDKEKKDSEKKSSEKRSVRPKRKKKKDD